MARPKTSATQRSPAASPETQTVPLSELHESDIVLVRPETRIPADGKVVEGAADVDESMVTGESRTVSGRFRLD